MKRSWMLLMPAMVAVLAFVGCWGSSKAPQRLQGAGSSFVDPMMQEWAVVYNKEKNVQVNYQSKGSASGISMMTGKEVDFGCSDAPLDEEQLAKCKSEGGDVIHVPLCMGAIVAAYNLPGVTDLTLSGQVLMDIYLGNIKRWNHPAIAKLNKDQTLPDKEIAVAFRSDGSGSTYILTDYFTKINAEAWTPGRSTNVKFPMGIGAKNNAGVAQRVKADPYSIGYVELIYALKEKITFAKMKNQAGKTIKADMKSVTAAAATAQIPDDLRYSITNAPGEDAYPIAGTVWALVYVKQPANKVQMLKDFLSWITHDGQQYCEKLDYAPLPGVLVKKIDAKLAKIEAGN
jgi:phosphate transport system substrate-binding protein